MADQRTEAWQVDAGMYVYDKNWKTWYVDARRYNRQSEQWEFAISDEEGQRHYLSLDGGAEMIVSIPYYSKAEALVAHYLKVQGVDRRVMRFEDMDQGRNTAAARRMMAFHLFEHHGISISPSADKSNGPLSGMVEAHNLAHARLQFVFPHVHVPIHEL